MDDDDALRHRTKKHILYMLACGSRPSALRLSHAVCNGHDARGGVTSGSGRIWPDMAGYGLIWRDMGDTNEIQVRLRSDIAKIYARHHQDLI